MKIIDKQEELDVLKTITTHTKFIGIEFNGQIIEADIEIDNCNGYISCNDSSTPSISCYGSSTPSIYCYDSSKPNISCNGSSTPSISCYDSSTPSISCYGSAIICHSGNIGVIECYANSLFITQNQQVQSNEHIIIQPDKKYNFFERYGLDPNATEYVLYKRVSSDFKTQEGTNNETLWIIGSTVTHTNWLPSGSECGAGKFHAVVKPFFADQFRDKSDDKYIAILVKSKDLYEWDNPTYPHKIAFREGTVLYECNRDGNKILTEE